MYFGPGNLFVTMALNDFIRLYAGKRAKRNYNFTLAKQIIWKETIALVRVFQAAIAECIRENVTKASYTRMVNLMQCMSLNNKYRTTIRNGVFTI